MPRPQIYLAGPDVFAVNALDLGERKKRLCLDYGFTGLFPLDNEIAVCLDSMIDSEIFRGNLAMIREADAGIFNLTPFRGVSADVGTAFELGLMFGLEKPVFAYSNCAEDLHARVARTHGAELHADEVWRDDENLMIEHFGNADNLMLDACLRQQGRSINRHSAAPNGVFDDLSSFVECLEQARRHFASRRD